ncbi:DUF4369 domain-containing protein [Flavobacterium granuli]|uniref:Uncharacterized protein DUF4369 n=1 Tax=Flavobacterium granuli TaxID=280093 RepID=A0A1M5Q2J7_9FLAO|nr:DUF4369 domain-containing protein [Flavobacterium granuli]PRZ22039.1 uncharacterized protein DUF4369 [Flavobacterium granuli]SHH07991.1 protein of unknown function [Flavobacterium granuli]
MKKIVLLLSATVVFISCSKVGKDEFLITGTATGIENGKTIILETPDENGMGVVSIDTVKVENGKFEIKGKVTEPSFHMLQLESEAGKAPYSKVLFILENGEINIAIDKDSIHKSKVSGTYSNDEYAKFNEEMKVVQKKLMDFQNKNMQAMKTAQETKDTAVINNLMKGYSKIQEEVGVASKTKYTTYSETHPKSFISVLIVQGMLNDPSADIKKTEAIYNSLDETLKNSKPGKAIKTRLTEMKSPSVGASAPAVGDAK